MTSATAAAGRWLELPSTDDLGAELYDLVRELFPLNRSLTGDGNRRTFEIVAQHAPFETVEVPSGTAVFDWTVPREWNVREAWIKGPDGSRVVDWADSNLHLLQYSVGVHERLSLDELRPHLYSDPAHPGWIPFRTSYWDENWGFCLADEVLRALQPGEYEVLVDASHEDGSMSYAEAVLPGSSDESVLLSAYACHPSLANDNLSGVALLTVLAKYLARVPHRLTYRFLLSPGTIGPITWLARNQDVVPSIRHGLVCVCVGDAGGITYKRSRDGDATVDRAVLCVLRDEEKAHAVEEFVPWGGDERQFSSPGVGIPMGALMRSPHGGYPEYHTSADDLGLVRPESLADSFLVYAHVLGLLDANVTYTGTVQWGEPQLGRRGLYPKVSAGIVTGGDIDPRPMLWVLNLADGGHTLLDMAERSGLPFDLVAAAARRLEEHGLLVREEGVS
jgi:aminopeptidase-like protein